jgi:hypothetical protein
MARLVLFAGIMGAVLWSAAARAAEPAPEVCKPPDAQLIKSRGQYTGRAELPDAAKIALYNEQADRFNECTRRLVDGQNAEIDQVREAANADIAQTRETANRKILDIQAKINLAVSGGVPTAADAPGAFPGPTCAKPDARAAQYGRLQSEYETCVKTYLERASTVSRQTALTANVEIAAIADRAKDRIAQLQGTVKSGIQTANAAALERSHSVEGTKLGVNDPVLMARAAENPVEDSKAEDAWPMVEETPSGEGDARAVICRAPQALTISRIMGPKVCRRNGVWAVLRKAGMDIGPDGITLVDRDLRRRNRPMACVVLPNQTQRNTGICN